MYKAIDVAKLVVNVCADNGHPVTNLKLQKILYFMWLDWYKKRKEYLFDDRIEAWHYGPVVPSVYLRYRAFLADPIRKGEESAITGSDARGLESFALKYNRESVGVLIKRSHESGSPWERAGGDGTPHTEIGKELMVEASGRYRRLRPQSLPCIPGTQLLNPAKMPARRPA